MSSKKQLEQLEKERERQVTRIFWMGLEIAIIFAVPLVAAIFIGRAIGGYATWVALGVAFVVSWSLVAVRYQRLAKKMQQLDADIKTLRNELGIQPRPEHKYPDEIEKEKENK